MIALDCRCIALWNEVCPISCEMESGWDFSAELIRPFPPLLHPPFLAAAAQIRSHTTQEGKEKVQVFLAVRPTLVFPDFYGLQVHFFRLLCEGTGIREGSEKA